MPEHDTSAADLSLAGVVTPDGIDDALEALSRAWAAGYGRVGTTIDCHVTALAIAVGAGLAPELVSPLERVLHVSVITAVETVRAAEGGRN